MDNKKFSRTEVEALADLLLFATDQPPLQMPPEHVRRQLIDLLTNMLPKIHTPYTIEQTEKALDRIQRCYFSCGMHVGARLVQMMQE